MSWLADVVDGNASGEALAAMLNGGFDMDLFAPDPALSTPRPSSPSDSINNSPLSVADCTDTASDNGTEWSSNSSSEPASPPLRSKHDKEAVRIANNHARLYRYYRLQGELVGLRRKAAELQSLLDKLEKKDAIESVVSLQTAPCPFLDDGDDEVGPHDHAPLKTSRSSTVRSTGSWKEAVMEEHRRLQRAQAVRRKLKRMLRYYKRNSERFMSQLHLEMDDPERVDYAPTRSWMPPSLPGAETVEAFMSSGIVLLRELYYIACCESEFSPSASVDLNKSGGKLAYSFLLGADIEARWSREYAFPRGDPRIIASLWLRGVRTQGPRNHVLRTVMKTHNFEHIFHERKFTWRPDALYAATTLDLDGVTMMQTFEMDDHVVFVWTVSFHASGNDSPPPPFFRASGWMVFRILPDGDVSCCSCGRVHSALFDVGGRPWKRVEREMVVNAWTKTLQAQQHRMWNRLLLVV